MKKNNPSRVFSYILHQIYNERRSNWALLAELLIVSCIVWFLVDRAYVMIVRAMEPTGFDTTNCYRLDIGQIAKAAPGYDPAHPDSAEVKIADHLALIERIRHDEDIECAAYSMCNDPFQARLYTSILKRDTIETFVRINVCQPDFLKVFRYHGSDGTGPEQLAAKLKDKDVLLSEGAFGGQHDLRRMIGKEFDCGFHCIDNDTLPKRLVGTFVPAKRFTWEEQAGVKSIIMAITPYVLTGDMGLSLAVRVKDSRAQGFEERFCEKIKDKGMRAGNFYVSGFNSYDKLQEDSETDQDTTMRFNVVAIVFLLVNVFLGLLGTFWFRTQHRFPEIGLQKAVGATNTDITLRLLAEAVLLMTIAFIPSLLIDLNIAYAGLTDEYKDMTLATGRFITCAAVAYVLMLLIIALGIWFPALRATKAKPAVVLRGE